jgi:hypothetical protein
MINVTRTVRAITMLAALAVPMLGQSAGKEGAKMQQAKGTFEVKLAPVAAAADDKSGISRMSIDKQFHGDLDAHSTGVMMSLGDPRSAAGYVAMETVTGTLNGKHGSFGLQHNGTIEHGSQSLNIIVVPGSGTGELAGISGTFHLVIEGGQHSYTLDYTLPAAK